MLASDRGNGDCKFAALNISVIYLSKAGIHKAFFNKLERSCFGGRNVFFRFEYKRINSAGVYSNTLCLVIDKAYRIECSVFVSF